MRFKYDTIFWVSLALPCLIILCLTGVFIYRPSIVLMLTDFQSLLLVTSFVLISILIRYLPIYYFKVNHENEIIKETAKQIVKVYEIKLVLLILLFISLLFQLISIGFRIGLRINGYHENAFVILLVGLIIMSYPNNVEDIIYIIHKLKICSSTKKASPNLYYLLGYKLEKIFKDELLEDLRAFQRPLLYMHFLAAHYTFNSSYWGDNLKKFYGRLLVYLLEKDFVEGAHAINSLNNYVDEIKLLNQKERISLFSLDESSGCHSDVDIEFIRKYFRANLIEKDNLGKKTNSDIPIKITIKNENEMLLKFNNEKAKAYLIGDAIFYEFDVKKENGKLNIYGKLKSSSLGFEFNDLKNSKMRIDRKSILITHIAEKSWYGMAIIFLIIILSIIYISLWFGGVQLRI